uniref:hypothetical protein n=1 Tax=Proteus mirabilis TaxID=584 RepID=UPI001C7D0EAF
EHIARITEMMFSPFHMQNIEKEVGNIDIVINTIPHLVVTANVISKMPAHTLVIDLASKPGGTDFRYAEKRGVKALLAPGLPGIVAPKTAGQILANVLSQLLAEDVIRRMGNEFKREKNRVWFYWFTLYVRRSNASFRKINC